MWSRRQTLATVIIFLVILAVPVQADILSDFVNLISGGGTQEAQAEANGNGGFQLIENWSASHPDTQIYYDSGTGQYLNVISSGSRYIPEGKSLSFGPLGDQKYWVDTGYYYAEYDRVTGRTAVREIINFQTPGGWTNWTPRIFVDNSTELSIIGNPKVWNDTPGYTYNVVDITYKAGNTQVTRRIRVIEGFIQEYFILDSDPRGSILISPIIERKDLQSREYYIQSADGQIYPGFTFNRETSEKLVNASYFKVATFPVIVDDSYSNQSMSQEAELYYIDTTKAAYLTIHDAVSTNLQTSGTFIVYNTYVGGGTKSYKIERIAMFFNTSSIPSGSTINSANLSLDASFGGTSSTNNEYINITNGTSQLYPHIPVIVADYHYLNYSTVYGGSLLLSSIPIGKYNISFSSIGLTFINITGSGAITKLFLRTSGDISATAPSGENYAYVATAYQGSSVAPVLYVYYTPGGPQPPDAAFSCTPIAGVRNATRTCTDASTNTPTNFDWYGTGSVRCIMANTSTQNPNIFPANYSYCSLCLIATNAQGSDTECKSNYLYISQPQVTL